MLLDLVRADAASAFGRAHRFHGIRNADDFRERVPVRGWEGFENDVERIARGERKVLTTEPVLRLEPTSGSTGGVKWVPVTRRFARERRRAVAAWAFDLHRRFPETRKGRAYWSITPHSDHPPVRESAVPLGFDEEASYLGGIGARLVAATFAVPPAVRAVGDLAEWRRATLLALLRAEDLSFVSVWHPSFLELLLDGLRNEWDLLVGRIRDGWSHGESALRLPPDAERGRRLERIGPEEPTRLWPGLALVSAWGDAGARGALAALARRLPGVAIQPKGILATEACISIPFGGGWPLAATSHFFELEDEGGRILAPRNASVDSTYGVVVTAGNGLWRYRIGDRVRIVGFVGECPSVRFVGRDRTFDLRGEKLSEPFLEGSLDELFVRLPPEPRFVRLDSDSVASPPTYLLAVELEGERGEARVESLANSLDEILRRNPHYDGARHLGQLGPLRGVLLPRGSFERQLRSTVGSAPLGAAKPSRIAWPRPNAPSLPSA
jgi:hypothetical protein